MEPENDRDGDRDSDYTTPSCSSRSHDINNREDLIRMELEADQSGFQVPWERYTRVGDKRQQKRYLEEETLKKAATEAGRKPARVNEQLEAERDRNSKPPRPKAATTFPRPLTDEEKRRFQDRDEKIRQLQQRNALHSLAEITALRVQSSPICPNNHDSIETPAISQRSSKQEETVPEKPKKPVKAPRPIAKVGPTRSRPGRYKPLVRPSRLNRPTSNPGVAKSRPKIRASQVNVKSLETITEEYRSGLKEKKTAEGEEIKDNTNIQVVKPYYEVMHID